MVLNSSLIAHRGDQENAVENTLSAFEAAAKAGARFVECDIQFTKELQPVVIHDDDLNRLCHRQGRVSGLTYDELKIFCSPCFELLSLSRLFFWLKENRQVTLFMEIKTDVLNRISAAELASVMQQAVPEELCPQIVIISYSAAILHACSKVLNCKLGWVTDSPLAIPEQIASVTSYVFTDVKHADQSGLWKELGVKLAVYTVNHPADIPLLIAKGVHLIETNNYSSMVAELSEQTF